VAEVSHSFEWGSFIIWLCGGFLAILTSAVNFFIRSREKKMAEMIKAAIEAVIEKADTRYVASEACAAAHKLTDQNMMSIRDDISDMKRAQSEQYNDLQAKMNLILARLIK